MVAKTKNKILNFDWTITIRDFFYVGGLIVMGFMWWHNNELYKTEAASERESNRVAIQVCQETTAMLSKQLNVMCVSTEKRLGMFTDQLDSYRSLSDAVLKQTIIMQGVQEDIKEIKSTMRKNAK